MSEKKDFLNQFSEDNKKPDSFKEEQLIPVTKPKREIIYAKSMYDVSKHIDDIYPKRKLLTISKANAFDIKKDDEVHTI